MTYDEYLAGRRTVATEHGEFAYLETGDGPPALFVHGLFMSGYMWHRTIDLVRGERRSIAYNLPAHGGSVVPADQPLDLDANAAMLEAFCDALELDDFDLVANDTGGAIAQIVAAHHADRVERLVLTSCDAFDNFFPPAFAYFKVLSRVPPSLALVGASLRVPGLHRLPLAYGWLSRKGIPREIVRSWGDPLIRSRGVRRDTAKVLRGAAPRYTLDAAARLSSFPRPALIAWARRDRFFPYEHAERLATIIPDSRLEPIEDSYTFVPEDQPERLASLIADFVAAPAAAATGSERAPSAA